MSSVHLLPTGSRPSTVEASAQIVVAARPNAVRRDTEAILSYYQSPEAGRSYSPPAGSYDRRYSRTHTRRMSSGSTSPSDYSSDDEASSKEPMKSLRDRDNAPNASAPPSGHRRRPSIPSVGGSDKRRLAIVEVDPPSSSQHDPSLQRKRSQTSPLSGGSKSNSSSPPSSTSNSPLLSRRGVDPRLHGLALVAPPDASPKTYTDLTPPPSAPTPALSGHANPTGTGGHHRSASEMTTTSNGGGGKSRHVRRKSSRDISIVGTSSTSTLCIPDRAGVHQGVPSPVHEGVAKDGLQPPIFLSPQSRSPSPWEVSGHSSPSSDYHHEDKSTLSASHLAAHQQAVSTPGIGEGKGIGDPVAGPVIVGLKWGSGSKQAREERGSGSSNSGTSSPFASADPMSYVNYHPGVHSTAGPLPPPPRAMFDIDHRAAPPPRPPRQPRPTSPTLRVETQAFQVPVHDRDDTLHATSTRDVLRPKAPGMDRQYSDFSIMAVSDDEKDDGPDVTESLHVREGAFPPSRFTSKNESGSTEPSPPRVSSPEPIPRKDSVSSIDGLPPRSDSPSHPLVSTPTMVIDPPREDYSSDDSSDESGSNKRMSWVSLSQSEVLPRAEVHSDEGMHASFHSSHAHSRSADLNGALPRRRTVRSLSRSRTRDIIHSRDRHGASNPIMATLTNFNLKRFSALPKPPSLRSRRVSTSTTASSRAVSPSLPSLPPRQKIKSTAPSAMYFNDVLAKRTALERAIGYAHKINELAMYDSGLEEWVSSVKHKGKPRAPAKTATLSPYGPSLPSDVDFGFQPRHISHGSQVSEATFPRRPDAYIATDLALRPTDDPSPPNGPPPALPYPSLAQAPTRTGSNRLSVGSSPSSTRSAQSPIYISKPVGGGFFSSIGRKASLKRDNRLGPTSPPLSNRLLTKSPPTAPVPASRPIMIQNPTVVPGGPRSPPGKIQRSRTLATSGGLSSEGEASLEPASGVYRRQSARPALYAGSHSAPPATHDRDPEFAKQVDRLADVLPHADKTVLAGYLRRAGQDIVAIGQYLEDEKNGTIRYD